MDQINIDHHSQQKAFRSPFGAVALGTKVVLHLAVDAPPGAVQSVKLVLRREGDGEETIPMALVEEKLYQVVIAPQRHGLWWYYFQVQVAGKTIYYGNNPQGQGGQGATASHVPPGYQLTVHLPQAVTPAWIKEGVMYQIYVDRFFNGCEDGRVLNPKPGSLIHSHWDDQPVYIRDCRNQRILRWDFFGGNLLGVIKKLPYLKELGVTVIYLNPIFEAPSNHKYDTADYKKIDSMYGDEETFITLCRVAKELGINIMLDGVFSHTGSDSIYFNREGSYSELGAYQSPQSKYYSWFRFHQYPDEYESWWGIDTLPNVNEHDPSYQEFMFDKEDGVVRKWIALGAKGWRLDVVDELPGEFVKLLRQAVKETDQEAVVLGEVWEDASNKVSYGERREYLLGEELDSTMNYPFRTAFTEFLLERIPGNDAQRRMANLWENYPIHHFYSAMNLVGTHDTVRILTLLATGDPCNDVAEADLAKRRLSPEQAALGKARLKLLALLQMTFPGLPSIYYGDEAGLEGYRDPLCRGPYPWGREDKELVQWHKRLIALRHQYPVLKTGQWIPLFLGEQVYGFGRQIKGGQDVFGQARPDNTSVILLNRHPREKVQIELEIGHWCTGPLVDVLAGDGEREYRLVEGKLTLELEPLTGKLLLEKVVEEHE